MDAKNTESASEEGRKKGNIQREETLRINKPEPFVNPLLRNKKCECFETHITTLSGKHLHTNAAPPLAKTCFHLPAQRTSFGENFYRLRHSKCSLFDVISEKDRTQVSFKASLREVTTRYAFKNFIF
ncbi:hypothetical protein AVEN_167672-1 [Araneus ventricosus]|uniref:Uncharacterized protein n=1 Tax=Araneus ventricosus TaxID=182803 RepID=A0A4Y2N9T6_ARAVE|nr:hypothetical protein AVEN_167672-1 [Araneus ventricosus]